MIRSFSNRPWNWQFTTYHIFNNWLGRKVAVSRKISVQYDYCHLLCFFLRRVSLLFVHFFLFYKFFFLTTAQVFFVDYGNQETVPIDRLRALPPEAVGLPMLVSSTAQFTFSLPLVWQFILGHKGIHAMLIWWVLMRYLHVCVVTGFCFVHVNRPLSISWQRFEPAMFILWRVPVPLCVCVCDVVCVCVLWPKFRQALTCLTSCSVWQGCQNKQEQWNGRAVYHLKICGGQNHFVVCLSTGLWMWADRDTTVQREVSRRQLDKGGQHHLHQHGPGQSVPGSGNCKKLIDSGHPAPSQSLRS